MNDPKEDKKKILFKNAEVKTPQEIQDVFNEVIISKSAAPISWLMEEP